MFIKKCLCVFSFLLFLSPPAWGMKAELLENKEAQGNGHITAKQSNTLIDDNIDEVEEKKESKIPTPGVA